MKLKFIRSQQDYVIKSEPDWGSIIFEEGGQKIVEVNGNILNFREWLFSFKKKIIKEQFFFGNPPDSLSKRIYLARQLDFFTNGIDDNKVFNLWHSKIFEYYESHCVVFGLRGEIANPYIIGLNGEYGEISYYNPDKSIDFKYEFDLYNLFESLEGPIT